MRIIDLTDWLDERLSISTLQAMAARKEVPLHRHSIWYYFGGLTLGEWKFRREGLAVHWFSFCSWRFWFILRFAKLRVASP
jgi:hypothetical protein